MNIIVTEADGFQSEYPTSDWYFDVDEDLDGRQYLEFEAKDTDEIHQFYFADFMRLDFVHD